MIFKFEVFELAVRLYGNINELTLPTRARIQATNFSKINNYMTLQQRGVFSPPLFCQSKAKRIT